MNRELVVPNLHVILIHYPLGVFYMGLAIEVLSIFWRRHSVRTAGHWMVLLGGLATLPAAMSGIYALHDIAVPNPLMAGEWKEVIKHAPLNDQEWHVARDHALWASISSVLVSLTIVTYLALSDRLRKKLYLPLLGVLLFGAVMMSSAAWHGGEMVYRHGLAVEPAGLAEGEKSARTEPAEATSQPMEAKPVYEKINTLFPPVQLHAILAGVAAAIALASVGVAFRRITSEVTADSEDAAESLVKSLDPHDQPVILRPAKFWLVAALFFILTSLGGWYVLASDADSFIPRDLWALVTDRSLNNGHPLNRRFAHVIGASLTIVLPFLLAILGKWAPRQKLALAVLAVILLGAVGMQVWLGVLLLFDTPSGPVTGFN